ncbi:DNA topoisomerase 1 isoform X3 [Denticeps clupeoides]|uniref:DNA topoisomerase 1 isoform X3 n=1 Tax=Denticeps clupeoides TaxID=299321 RepID=UPI0010A43A82|nr:DNA topoisomerase 1-like isoform X3 [Denticeps clupeoides]
MKECGAVNICLKSPQRGLQRGTGVKKWHLLHTALTRLQGSFAVAWALFWRHVASEMEKDKKTKQVKREKREAGSGGGTPGRVSKKVKSRGVKKSQGGDETYGEKEVKQEQVESSEFQVDDAARLQLGSKEEPADEDFVQEKRGKKRKRQKEDESGKGTSCSSEKAAAVKKKKRTDISAEAKTDKKKNEGKLKMPKKEESEKSVTKKKTKEEIEAARTLKRKLKEEEEQQRWRWWEEEKYEAGIKWKFLEHKGPYFPPEYNPLPENLNFYYNGEKLKLGLRAEEVALYFAQMLDHEYTTREVFRNNFFKDWRKEMTLEERMLITDLEKCDFGEYHNFHKQKVEERKNRTKEEKQVLKEANQKITDEYGFCMLDHHRERIGNFKIEPPGLFRGRGDHPKQGLLKKRIRPEDVIINCSKESHVPEPPAGHQWKEVRHDNTVTWLASWTDNVQGATKYVMLNANSKLKGEKDWEKYEVARQLKSRVDGIRAQYKDDLKSKQMGTRQRAVALYFIDKLALRAGNEKEEGETADTVGCCSLRVEHIMLHDSLDGEKCVVEFDFLGKDCIRYYNKVPVTKRVFKNLKLFMENKQPGDDLFDRLNIEGRKEQLTLAKAELKKAKKEAKGNSDTKLQFVVEKKKKAMQRCEEQLLKMEVQATDREENKEIALSTSKLNYLDPRISVAWCKNMEVQLDKIYNKTQRDKFAWAIHMTEKDFEF